MANSIASFSVSDLVRPKAEGVPVNSHVIPAVFEPSPDYEAMRVLVATPLEMTGSWHGTNIKNSTAFRR